MQIKFKTLPTFLYIIFIISHFGQLFLDFEINYNYWIVTLLFLIWLKLS